MRKYVQFNRLVWFLVVFVNQVALPLAAQEHRVPPHIDLRVQLTGDNGEPMRNVRFPSLLFTIEKQLEISVSSGISTEFRTTNSTISDVVYYENHTNIWTNYDGYIEIQLGKEKADEWSRINWLPGNFLYVKISEGDPRRPGQHRTPILHNGTLPTTAYSHATNNLQKPGIGEIELFSDTGHPNIELRGESQSNYGFLDFSFGESDFASRIRGDANNRRLIFLTKGDAFSFSKVRDNGNPYLSNALIRSGADNEISFELTGNSPKINFSIIQPDGASNSIGQIGWSQYHDLIPTENSPTYFTIQSYNEPMIITTRRENRRLDFKPIEYHASEHIFSRGPVKINSNGNRKTLERFALFMGSRSNNEDYIVLEQAGAFSQVPNTNMQGIYLHDANSPVVHFSLKTESNVEAEGFYVISDLRLKKITAKHLTSPLQQISNLKVVSFRFIDQILHNNGERFGLVAQEVENIIPEAVTYSTNVIPNIFQMSTKVEFNSIDKSLIIYLDSITDININDKIRIIGEESHLLDIEYVKEGLIKVKGWPEENTQQVFVYGRQVDDFRTVDYDQIFTLNVAATQELIKQVETLQAQVADLEAARIENRQLREEMDQLSTRLARLEAAMNTPATGTPSEAAGERN